jgi:O-antigen ligase
MKFMIKRLLFYFKYKPDILLPLFAFFLTLSLHLAKGIIILYLILWVYNKQYKELIKLKYNWFVLSSIAYFGVFALSGLYSENLVFWMQDLEGKIPLLIVPIILSTKSISKQVVRATIWGLAIGCFVLILYGYYKQPTDFISLRDIINKYTPINVIYYSLYISTVFFFLLYDLLSLKDRRYKGLYIISIFFAHYILYGCASRMAILTTFIVAIGTVFVWKIIFERKVLQGVGLIFLIILINGISLLLSNSSSARFETLVSEKGDNRVEIWKASWLTIKKSPIIGYGSGDRKSALAPSYIEIGYPLGVAKSVNCHNQYLESWLGAGISGLLIILIWLFATFYNAWNKQNYLFCVFIVIIAMNILTESIFERQHGTYFIAFFGSLLFGLSQKEKCFKENSK